ncbi:PTS sugar transporter subunit IIA [Lacticaseibacillus suibinensis]|uniref:PTS sugar transporter subunit IIA n=1 Tax=Lacticaseibacillus suibinensis TaxID=2486011 RepID=UPI000F787441|nr:hypothetical protein [Lacticaseibacillus suibinensis]
MNVILISHSNLALGMKDTVELIMGKQPNLHAVAAYVDDSVSLISQLDQVYSKFSANSLNVYVTDVEGGSVNTETLTWLKGKTNSYVIAGMSLPLVLGLLTTNVESGTDQEFKELLRNIVEDARMATKFEVVEASADEEDF